MVNQDMEPANEQTLLATVLKMAGDMGRIAQTTGDTRDAVLKLHEGQVDLKGKVDQFNFGFTQLRKEFDEMKAAITAFNIIADKVETVFRDLYGDAKIDGIASDVRKLKESDLIRKRDEETRGNRIKWWSGVWAAVGTLVMTGIWHVVAYLIRNISGEP